MLENKKECRKEYIKYRYDQDTIHLVSVSLASLGGVTLSVAHTRDDIQGLQNQIDISDQTIFLEGNTLPKTVGGELVVAGKTVNLELYKELWRCYDAINDATSEEEVDDVEWEYDIEQVYNV